ncbi:endonuclease domain-containing protein [Streptomyces sp. NPDC003035]|uniref:endonuclease domain-containing protein n=1 Tax=Streptomyces sp. NPDC003035 TaxID=3364676 RepID=UPI0036BF76DB
MRDLARLARGGVLLTEWVYAAGRRGGLPGRRLREEGWQRICRGAWAVPGKEVDWKVRARAVQLLRPELVCSHGTAAALHRVEVLGGQREEVLEFTAWRRGGGRSGRAGLRVHTTGRLTEGDTCVRAGLRVTSPARTVGDLIRSSGTREEAVVAADSALSRRTVRGIRREPLVRRDDLAAELAPDVAPRRPGAARARGWLPLTNAASGSPAESVARLRMHDAGLHPECQPLLRSRSGRSLRPDFFFRAAGLAIEIEGYAFHGTRHAHDRDVRRFNDLADCPGVRRVLRFTAADVFHHPDRVIVTIRSALGSLGSSGAGTGERLD